MEYGDIIELVGAYLVFFAVAVTVPLGAVSLWSFFKALADPHFKNED